jgi:cell division protein FtsQ
VLARRKGNRRLEKTRNFPPLPWRRIGIAASAAVVLALITSSMAWMLDRPIEQIKVEGSFQRVSALDIERAARKRVANAGLVSVPLPEVRGAIQALPWVDEVSVARQWPNGLRVRVTEQSAMARWNDTRLVNMRGEIFTSQPQFVPTELPLLSGPEGTDDNVIHRYLAIQGRLVEAGMRLLALRLDARGAWEFDLDNGVTVRLGRTQIEERFELFSRVGLPLLAARATEVAYIDLRYGNGFAVGWRVNTTRLADNTIKKEPTPHA